MKLRVDTKSFVDAVAWVTKNYDAKDDRAYVALSIDENGNGYFSHTNPTSYMKSNFTVLEVDFNGDDVDEAQFAVDGKFLRTLAKAVGSSAGDVVISKKLKTAKTALEVKTSSGKFTLPLFDSVVAKAPKVVEIGEVDDSEFFDMLLRISKLCDTNTSGSSMFTGAVDFGFSKDDSTVKLFATDRFALGEVILEFTANEETAEDDTVVKIMENHALLPYSNAVLVPPSKGVSTSVSIIAEASKSGAMRLGYSFPDGRVALFSLLDAAPFPTVAKMKEKALESVEYNIVLPKTDLINAINVVSSLTWDEDHIYLNISDKGLVVSNSTDSNSLSVEHLDLDYTESENYRAKFLRATINESFSPIMTNNVRLKWGAKSNAFVFEPVTEDGESVDNVFVMSVLAKN